MAKENENLRLEFLFWHIDDEPSIAESRSLSETVQRTIATAMNLAVIGEVDGATKLLGVLRDNGSDAFQFPEWESPFLKPCMFFAWEATSSWPAWISEDERTKEKLQEIEGQGRKLWLERFSEEWEVTEGTAKKAMDMAYNGLVTVLPDLDGTLAGQVAQTEAMWKNGDFSYSSNPNGPMSIRYSKIAMWWRQGIYPYLYLQLYRTAGLAIALDIYLRLGQENEARDVFEQICSRFHAEEQVEHLVCSRMAWKTFLAAPERPLLDLLDIHPAKLRSAASRAVQLVENRLINGRSRRYATQNTEELVRIISENTFKNCPYDRLDAYRPAGHLRPRPDSPHGLLKAACTRPEIVSLEKRLGVTLPQDYIEFLSVTNGLESAWNGQNALDYFASADDVCWLDIDFLAGNELPLLPDGEPKQWLGDRLQWPEIEPGHWLSLSGDVMGGEAPGYIFLLGPDLIQPAKDYLLKTYGERDETQRRDLDNLIQETYGSMEALRDLDHVLLHWTPWDLDFIPFHKFRDVLEWIAEASLRKNRPWLNVFEPRYRRLA
ncbi:hypothetical protein FAVG1_09295 [Fusarium avenaceum]|nr:hypothetical protein FAVG1_09295 [Fusarium avenaceum]